jgi:cytoskeleton-associated protein 5
VFREPDPPYPRFSTHSLLKNPPAPVVLSPPRLATTSTAINYIISQITSSNREESIKALKQIEGVVANPRYIPALVPHVDHLLRAVLMQLRITFATPLATASDPQSQQQVMEHAKRLVSSVVALFSETKLAVAPSLGCLCEVETGVLSYLCDDRLLKLEEVAQLNRAFNYLMYRICENCEKTVLFSSLLRVLLKSIASDGTQTKLTELSMKCIWKVTRQIPQYVPGLKVDELLKEMQDFFHGYAEIVPTPRADDKPYRTAKTILFHLTEHMGTEILDHMSLVAEQSRVAVYIRKTLAKKRLSSEGSKKDAIDGQESTGTSKKLARKEKVVEQSPFLHDGLSLKDLVLLGEIIDKLTPETEHQGLKELYSFQVAHPDVNIPSLFRHQSSLYQAYIVKGLELMKEEQQMLDNGETPAVFKPEMLASDHYVQAKKKSRELREKTANLLNVDLEKTVVRTPVARATTHVQAPPTQDENRPAVACTAPAAKPPISTATSKTSIGSTHLEDFRRRLEKLKENK